MEGKVIVTSSVLVVKLDETKFECMISSNVDVIDRIKIQKIKYVPKSGMSYFARSSGKILVYVCQDVWRGGKASALATPVTLACSEMQMDGHSCMRSHMRP